MVAYKKNPADLTDEKLVEKITKNDQELYIHIVERYQGPLIRYVRTIVYEHEAAEDVVQNTFIKAYQNLRSFKLDKKFSSWIYRIAHNEGINYIKKHKREVRPDDETWFDSVPDERLTAEDEVDLKILKSATGSAIAKLEEKYREPLTLFYLEAKSYQEIGEILRIPTATVGTRINRAKKQLKDLIKEKGVENE